MSAFSSFLALIFIETDVISVNKLKAKCKTNLNASIELAMMKFAQDCRSY